MPRRRTGLRSSSNERLPATKERWKIFERNLETNVRTLHLILALVMLVGCVSQTIRPGDVRPAQASFDGTHQDSGVISVTQAGALVTSRVRDRYNGLIAHYGTDKAFVPPLVPDRGVQPASSELVARHGRGSLFILDHEAVVNFALMNRWRRMGKPPAPAPIQ